VAGIKRKLTAPLDARMEIILKIARLSIIAGILLTFVSCARRQTTVRLVYAPAPPPAPSSTAAEQSKVLIIQEPAPPQPEAAPSKPQETPPVVSEGPKPMPSRKVDRSETVDSSPPKPEVLPPPNAPQLEPLSSMQQKTALQQQIGALKEGIQLRISRLSRLGLSSEDRRALNDARRFLSQSDTAVKQGDLQQSLKLAEKADLLVSAVEKNH
jgi:hypothetical protein